MSEPVVIPAGGGEVIGDAPDRRVEVLCGADAVHATWTRFGPRRDGADLHVHRRHNDLFYVLEGELTLMLGLAGEPVRAPAGALVRVPPLVVHGFRNESDAELRYLNLHAPGEGFADYMRGIRDGRRVGFDQDDPPPDGGRPASEAVIGGDADVDAIGVAQVRYGPGAPPPPPHVHDEVHSLYVLAGEVTLAAGDRERHAPAGSWLQIPAGLPHAVRAAGVEPAHCLSLRSR
jgi:quercetin dioxygenase-like cupin family protein